MANGVAPRFLQSSAQRRGQRGLQGFRLRTGQRFPDLARAQFLEQQLEEDVTRGEAQARAGLAFRQQEEAERAQQVLEEQRQTELGLKQRQFDLAQQQATQQQGVQNAALFEAQRQREREGGPVAVVSNIVSSFT